MPAASARELGYSFYCDPLVPPLDTRFGLLRGNLVRVPVEFPAEEGQSLVIEATCFIAEDWLGPLVIGWKGCLERMRSAFDPSAEAFYFAEL